MCKYHMIANHFCDTVISIGGSVVENHQQNGFDVEFYISRIKFVYSYDEWS